MSEGLIPTQGAGGSGGGETLVKDKLTEDELQARMDKPLVPGLAGHAALPKSPVEKAGPSMFDRINQAGNKAVAYGGNPEQAETSAFNRDYASMQGGPNKPSIQRLAAETAAPVLKDSPLRATDARAGHQTRQMRGQPPAGEAGAVREGRAQRRIPDAAAQMGPMFDQLKEMAASTPMEKYDDTPRRLIDSAGRFPFTGDTQEQARQGMANELAPEYGGQMLQPPPNQAQRPLPPPMPSKQPSRPGEGNTGSLFKAELEEIAASDPNSFRGMLKSLKSMILKDENYRAIVGPKGAPAMQHIDPETGKPDGRVEYGDNAKRLRHTQEQGDGRTGEYKQTKDLSLPHGHAGAKTTQIEEKGAYDPYAPAAPKPPVTPQNNSYMAYVQQLQAMKRPQVQHSPPPPSIDSKDPANP